MTTPCFRCKGSGQKFGGTCFRCQGTGQESNARDLPKRFATNETIEDILGSAAPTSVPPMSDLTKDIAALRLDFSREKLDHAKAISALERLIADVHKLEKAKRAELEAQIASVRKVEITLRSPGHAERQLASGHYHPKFETLLRIGASRQVDGFAPNIYISGPTGSGKSTGAKQLAQALQLPYFFNGAISMEHKLIGWKDASGAYHDTPFRRAFASPGVYCFDDVDSSDPVPLLTLNSALANGACDFPDAIVPRHPDSIIIATANTWGLGATSDYVGRTKQDAAFLSRFPAKLHWGYDEVFEVSICGNAAWAQHVQAARKRALALGLKVVIDPRVSIAGAALIANGFTLADAAELTYLASLSPDQKTQMASLQ